jgi:hypothetical protein
MTYMEEIRNACKMVERAGKKEPLRMQRHKIMTALKWIL